jgi:hypothetical protein
VKTAPESAAYPPYECAVCLTTAIGCWNSRLLAFHEALELARAPGLAQLAHRLGLDLANPFARDGEQLADLFEGAVGLQADRGMSAGRSVYSVTRANPGKFREPSRWEIY